MRDLAGQATATSCSTFTTHNLSLKGIVSQKIADACIIVRMRALKVGVSISPAAADFLRL